MLPLRILQNKLTAFMAAGVILLGGNFLPASIPHAMPVADAATLSGTEKAINKVYTHNLEATLYIRAKSGAGSGVMFRKDGYLLTNFHVVAKSDTKTGETLDAPDPMITLPDGREVYGVMDGTGRKMAAELVKYDKEKDLAILKIVPGFAEAPEVFSAARLGNSKSLVVGQQIIAIGNPLGLRFLVSSGIVSKLQKEDNKIISDTAINHGNSGGPLFDTDGEVVGINQAIMNGEDDAWAGISVSIPIEEAMPMINSLPAYQKPAPVTPGSKVPSQARLPQPPSPSVS